MSKQCDIDSRLENIRKHGVGERKSKCRNLINVESLSLHHRDYTFRSLLV